MAIWNYGEAQCDGFARYLNLQEIFLMRLSIIHDLGRIADESQ
jgi:hypothetical protein